MIIKIILILLLSTLSFGHKRNEKLVDPIKTTVDGNLSSNHAGYGYLGRSSEEEASFQMNFVCPEKYYKSPSTSCAVGFPGVIDKENYRNVEALNYVGFITGFRNKIYEYHKMMKTSLLNHRPVTLKKPSCVTDAFKMDIMPAFMDSVDTRTALMDKRYELQKKKKLSPSDEKSLGDLTKVHTMKSKQDFMNISQAIMTLDHYKVQRNEFDCAYESLSNYSKMMCISLDDHEKRLKAAYPFLDLDRLSDSEKKTLHTLKRKMLYVVGSEFCSEGTTYADVVKRGEEFYNLSLKNSTALGAEDDSMDQLYEKAFKRADDGKYLPVDEVSEKDQKLASVFDEIQKLSGALTESYGKRLDETANKICGKQTQDLMKEYPQVLRQYLLDLPEEERQRARKYLCQNNLEREIQSGVANTCIGVTGDIDSPEGVRVKRDAPTFPYSSKVDYSVKRNKDGTFEVLTRVNFQFVFDPTLGTSKKLQRAKFDKVVKKWKKKMNAFYNTSKVSDQGVKIKYEVDEGTDDPLIKVSECFNSGLDEPESHYCGAMVENWENAANFTTGMDDNTLYHEMGHNLGLDDEYNRDYYPFNTLGEDDSVMNTGSKLYERHIGRILQPALNCSGK
jgi:hypothetical protein